MYMTLKDISSTQKGFLFFLFQGNFHRWVIYSLVSVSDIIDKFCDHCQ